MSDVDITGSVVNPEAVGDPAVTPVVEMSPGRASWLRGGNGEGALDLEARAEWLAERMSREVDVVPLSLRTFEERERLLAMARVALEVLT